MTYPDKIYYQLRFYPLVKSHPHAFKSAFYAECAARQNKFWKFHDLLFENQSFWSQVPEPDPIFHDLARQAGMNLKNLDACLENPQTKKSVLDEKDEGASMGVRRTPTFFVNGRPVIGTQALQQELDSYFSASKNKAGKP
jgi:protein-disulfide isomerase